jgi:phospholipid-binding lipoprotein MlaA
MHNFFRNIGDVGNLANNVLQLKPHAAGVDTARLIFNTTFGLLGFIDVGTKMGCIAAMKTSARPLAIGAWAVVPM